MNFEKFILENKVDQAESLVDVNILEAAEAAVGMKFGKELTEYLLKYGYLAFEFIELCGMNSRQGLESDLVKQTLYLHRYYSKTAGYVILENQGEGDYYVVSGNDEVYEYDSNLNQMIDTKLSLFDYILERFQSAKNKR